MAADVDVLLDSLGIESAPVVGWSMGGYVAQALAAAQPELVSRLVLLATDPGGSNAARCAPGVWSRLTDRSGSPREQASRLIALLFPPAVAEAIDRDFGDLVAAARAALDPRALDVQERAVAEWHSTPPSRLALGIPVLAAAGELDEVIPAANAAALASGPADWRARFAGGSHAFTAQEPDRLAAVIAASWLTRRAESPSRRRTQPDPVIDRVSHSVLDTEMCTGSPARRVVSG